MDSQTAELVTELKKIIWSRTSITICHLSENNPWYWAFFFIPQTCAISKKRLWLEWGKMSWYITPGSDGVRQMYLSRDEFNIGTPYDKYLEAYATFYP